MHRTIVDSAHGKASLSDFRVLLRFNTFALLEASPKTGRTYEIRAHLGAINSPTLGDQLYGDKNHPLHNRLSRLGLHTKSISMTHPLSEVRLTFEAPYPGDFNEVLSSPVN
jgi:23S rRNA-/tRNA-specific pseudouridylate synthase